MCLARCRREVVAGQSGYSRGTARAREGLGVTKRDRSTKHRYESGAETGEGSYRVIVNAREGIEEGGREHSGSRKGSSPRSSLRVVAHLSARLHEYGDQTVVWEGWVEIQIDPLGLTSGSTDGHSKHD